MRVPTIFKEVSKQSLFEKQGFIVIENFLSAEEIQYMDRMFDELHPTLPDSGFFAGSYSPDMEYKKKVSEEIKVVFNRAYEDNFKDYTPFGGAYLYKISSPNSDLFVHQDWTVVDESKYLALNIWVPLCDITSDNGPLMVLPGSHYPNFPVIRAPTMRYFFDHDCEKVIRQLEPMIVKAGTAVVLSQSLVHYSPPNTSGKIRKAITAGLKTKGAQMIFHYKAPSDTDGKSVEKFEMEDDFFIHFDDFFKDIYKRPTVGRSIGFIEYEVPMLMGDELDNAVRKMKLSAGFEYKVERIVREPDIAVNINDIEVEKKHFWQIYTPKNIIREIIFRITGK